MRRIPKKQPKYHLFREQADEIVRKYEAKVLKKIFEIVCEKSFSQTTPVNLSGEQIEKINKKLKKQNIYIIHLEKIIREMEDYLNLHLKICMSIHQEIKKSKKRNSYSSVAL
jgi:hypothetical protein